MPQGTDQEPEVLESITPVTAVQGNVDGGRLHQLPLDASVTVNGDPITYTSAGTVPRGATEVERDETSWFPHMWSPGTEFILFLNRHDDDGASSSFAEYHYPTWGYCGRVLTDSRTVTCSDGQRTRLKFMDGVDRDEFIAAIQTEVANPSDTATPYPFPSLTPSSMDTASPP